MIQIKYYECNKNTKEFKFKFYTDDVDIRAELQTHFNFL